MAGDRDGKNGGRNRVVKVLEAILDEQRATRKEVERHGQILEEHTRILGEHTRILGEHTRILEEHGRILHEHDGKLSLLVNAFLGLSERFDRFLTGPHQKDHEELRERIARLEERAGHA